MTSNYLTEALQVLGTVQGFVFPGRPEYLHPYTILTALLTHVPSEAAKQELAMGIVETAADGDILAGLLNLTDYWWTSLLVPRNSIYPFHCLLMKSAD